MHRKGLNSLIILAAWELWKHRNNCVFNNALPRCIWLLGRSSMKEQSGVQLELRSSLTWSWD
uniref:Uncharacterized protein n=1 Tax=Arundo donax TaxID=35708 RepID=A0A0A9BEL1_ARUDO